MLHVKLNFQQTVFSLTKGIYRNNLKNRDFGKEVPQNFDSERATIAERQGASENQNSEEKPTQSKTDSSSCFGIQCQIQFAISFRLNINKKSVRRAIQLNN
jgi:hypothetical protein